MKLNKNDPEFAMKFVKELHDRVVKEVADAYEAQGQVFEETAVIRAVISKAGAVTMQMLSEMGEINI